jgi:hypothetical protein
LLGSFAPADFSNAGSDNFVDPFDKSYGSFETAFGIHGLGEDIPSSLSANVGQYSSGEFIRELVEKMTPVGSPCSMFPSLPARYACPARGSARRARPQVSSSDSLRSTGEKEIHRYMMLSEVSGGWNAGSQKSAVVSGAL